MTNTPTPTPTDAMASPQWLVDVVAEKVKKANPSRDQFRPAVLDALIEALDEAFGEEEQ